MLFYHIGKIFLFPQLIAELNWMRPEGLQMYKIASWTMLNVTSTVQNSWFTLKKKTSLLRFSFWHSFIIIKGLCTFLSFSRLCFKVFQVLQLTFGTKVKLLSAIVIARICFNVSDTHQSIFLPFKPRTYKRETRVNDRNRLTN